MQHTDTHAPEMLDSTMWLYLTHNKSNSSLLHTVCAVSFIKALPSWEETRVYVFSFLFFSLTGKTLPQQFTLSRCRFWSLNLDELYWLPGSQREVDRMKSRLPGLSVKVWSIQRLWVSIGDAILTRGLTLMQWTVAVASAAAAASSSCSEIVVQLSSSNCWRQPCPRKKNAFVETFSVCLAFIKMDSRTAELFICVPQQATNHQS